MKPTRRDLEIENARLRGENEALRATNEALWKVVRPATNTGGPPAMTIRYHWVKREPQAPDRSA